MWMMWDRNGRNGNFNEYLASVNGNEGRQYLADIMNGRFDNLNTLAQLLNTSVDGIKTGVFGLQNAITEVSGQIGMSGLQTVNAIQAGNTSILSKLCECCCENRLAICQQTNQLETAISNHDANMRLQLAQSDAANQLSVCQQTNILTNKADSNTNSILNAIQTQNAMLEQRFCEIKERELQSKIDTQANIITQLRGQIDNDRQTAQLYNVITPIQNKLTEIASKQPNTVPVQYPNLVAVNTTPNSCGCNTGCGCGTGCSQYPYGYFGNGFGGNIIF
ncbi:hypothetical protein [Clostridium sp.]|uniref:hypothetical protein n=1 Tax=Clostridium sp. TaxID=1506 RepID=UPI0025C530BE|nr:hypothetical protein [Clostridium sp.]